RRRITLSVAAAALVAAAGIGTWALTSGDDAGATPQDTKNSAPAAP
ncbi:serine/threonine protein kinase, partial [Streptomyces sp. NPDC002491]